jgi:hypothetical protein
MHSSSKRAPSFKKSGLAIEAPLANLPFMFSVGVAADSYSSTSASDRKELQTALKEQKIKSSFNQELQKLGVPAKLIPEKNPLKGLNGRNESPSVGVATGLPFQRRARSNSPLRESLKIQGKNSNCLFAPRSPVMGSHKMKFKEDFTGLCRESGNCSIEEDEDLRRLKEEYRRMLEGITGKLYEDDSDEIEDEGEIEKIENQFGFAGQRRYFK